MDFGTLHYICKIQSMVYLSAYRNIHLTGCDATSKVGTKKSALRVAESDVENLLLFGKAPLSNDIIFQAEQYLTNCISTEKAETLDVLRYITYHKQSFTLNTEKLPPTSASIHLHKRAYLQCYRWLHALVDEDISLNPIEYGSNYSLIL